MTRIELTNRVSLQCRLSAGTAIQVVDALFAADGVIGEALASGEVVDLDGFGQLFSQHKLPRIKFQPGDKLVRRLASR